MPRARAAMLAVVLAACGGGAGSDAPMGDDGDAPFDARPLTDAVVATCTPRAGTDVTYRLVATATDFVMLITAPPGDRRQFVVLQDGAIQILVDDQLVATPFLDLTRASGGPVMAGGERGLLGLAFHPHYAENGRFFVFYTTVHTDGAAYDELAEYRVSATDPARADRDSARILLSIPDYADNHNAGMIELGADGYLYLSTGDGGGNGDPQRTAQDKFRLLGKMLRLDIDTESGGRPYGIPPDNPYADGVAGAPEVWMYGLRNPWRWSFDRATGDLYIGDVGHHCAEEIDVVPAGSARGADLGWSDCEGTLDKYGTSCNAPAQPNRLRPVYEEIRPNPTFGCNGPSTWRAVIGGQVYRGACYPDLVGRYFFADHVTPGVYSFVYAGGQATDLVHHTPDFMGMNVIHADALGELWTGDISGRIHRIEVQ